MALNVERLLEKKGINKAKLSELLGRGDNRSLCNKLVKVSFFS